MEIGDIVRGLQSGRMFIITAKKEVIGFESGRIGSQYLYEVQNADGCIQHLSPMYMSKVYVKVSSMGNVVNQFETPIGGILYVRGFPNVVVGPEGNLVCIYNIVSGSCRLVDKAFIRGMGI